MTMPNLMPAALLLWEPIELADKDGYISVPVLAEMGQYDIVRAKWSFGLQAWVKDGRLMDPQPTLFCKVLKASAFPSSHTNTETTDKAPDNEPAFSPVESLAIGDKVCFKSKFGAYVSRETFTVKHIYETSVQTGITQEASVQTGISLEEIPAHIFKPSAFHKLAAMKHPRLTGECNDSD